MKISHKALRAVATVVVVALAATACGGADDGAASTSTVATTTAITTTVPETSTVATTTTTTTTLPETSADDPIVVAYCTASAENEQAAASLDPFDPDSLRDNLESQIEALDQLEIPGEIEGDIAVRGDGIGQWVAVLEPVDFAFLEVQVEIQALSEDPEFLAASDNIEMFEELYCPEPAPVEEAEEGGADEFPIEVLLESAAGREAIAQGISETTEMTEEDALCFVESAGLETLTGLFEIGTTGAEPDAEVQAGLLAGLDACGLSLDAFAG